MIFLIAMLGALGAPEITPLTDEAIALIEPGLTCSAITETGDTVFLTDGALALLGIDGKAVRVSDTDNTMGLPEEFSGEKITFNIRQTGSTIFLEEEERSYVPADLFLQTETGTSRIAVQFSCSS
jgi:hypothetical protein